MTYELTGRGQTLVFIHGAYINEEIWEKQVPFFSSRYQVVSVRLPSHGNAPSLPVEEYRIEDFSSEILALLDKLDVGQCVAIGLSLGSMIAQNLAARYPDRVHGIVLLGNVASMRLTLLERTVTAVLFPKWLALMVFGSLTTKQFMKLSFMMTWFMRGNKWLGNAETRQKIREMIGQMDRDEIKKVFAAVHTFRKQRLDQGDFPILLVNGQFDSPIIHQHARYLQKAYPGRAEFERIPGCGHACNYDDAESFNVLLLDWLVRKSFLPTTANETDYTSGYNRSLETRLSN